VRGLRRLFAAVGPESDAGRSRLAALKAMLGPEREAAGNAPVELQRRAAGARKPIP
jgi:hypothetical protein